MKIISIVGARPNFIKITPFCRQISKHGTKIQHLLVHTGQHYDQKMSEAFFEALNIPKPDINLGVGSATHAQQTAKIMLNFEPVCIKHRPDWIVVVGDVNSTMACSLVAAKLGIRIAHIEAGLRSFDRTMPEEINRIVTDSLADLLFTPSADAGDNLLAEGVNPKKIFMVGNIMIDTLAANLDKAKKRRTYKKFGLAKKKFIYVTLHRPGNVDQKKTLELILEKLADISRTFPVVFPVHPRTRQRMIDFGLENLLESLPDSNLFFTEPICYHDSLCLCATSRLVITDSGGIQEETTWLGVPCLTLRPNTERPVTITHGTNKLTSLQSLEKHAEQLLCQKKFVGKPPPLWDGNAAARIVDILLNRKIK